MAQGPELDLSPLILDELYEYSDSTHLRIGEDYNEGLLASTDFPAALLSMSAYGKPQHPDLTDLDATRPLQDPSYAAFAQPSFASDQPFQQPLAPHGSNTEQLPCVAGSPYQTRAPYHEPQSAFLDIRPRPIPEITSYTPSGGPQGTKIYIYILSHHELTAPPLLSFHLMFASRRCSTELTKIDQPGPFFQYALTANVPPLPSTGWHTHQVPIRVQVEDEAGGELGAIDVGAFTYMDRAKIQTYASPVQMPRKRKISAESAEVMRIASKRPSTQQLRTNVPEDYNIDPYPQSQTSPYSPFLQPDATGNSYAYFNLYDRSAAPLNYPQKGSRPASTSYHHQPASSASQPSMKAPSPRAPSWSPSRPSATQVGKSPSLSTPSAMGRVSAVPSPSGSANPPLIRTSTLQQSPSPANTPAGAAQSNQLFNPYAMYPHKAVLRLDGDLDGMAENWTMEEWEVKRRLVQFWRSQSGSTINANFKPVTPEERPPNSICISCIWWEEKKECFVTSVDTIYLLESLVGVRFTVEEKNRIRRNLEGFRPLTVSKAKADSEDFFKIIMGFPNPKPRNIEKDVKVYSWKILAHALKKIIGKYSASYSSTAGALLTPVSSTYGSAGPSESSTEQHPTVSPRPASDATTFSAYNASLTSTALSPNQPHIQQSPARHLSGPSNLQVAVPTLAQAYATTPSHYPYQSQSQPQPRQHMSQVQPHASLMTQPGRASWDYASFINTSPTTGAASNAPAMHYQRGVGGMSVAPDPSSSAAFRHHQQTSRA
ncbi:hypothetical protein MMC16_000033 [Acarospora aff. strigata]|nr:hypothetical protein [Acarospora aff. strigata]